MPQRSECLPQKSERIPQRSECIPQGIQSKLRPISCKVDGAEPSLLLQTYLRQSARLYTPITFIGKAILSVLVCFVLNYFCLNVYYIIIAVLYLCNVNL